MKPEEREAYTVKAAQLFAGFNVSATPERLEAYWIGLQDMHLVRFAALVDSALGPDADKWTAGKLPTVSKLWQRFRDMRARAPGPPPVTQTARDLGYEPTEWQTLANRIGMHYCRQVGEAGPAAVKSAWDALRRIAAWYELLAADHDPEATPERMKSAIVDEFRRICGLPPMSSQAGGIQTGLGPTPQTIKTESENARAREARW